MGQALEDHQATIDVLVNDSDIDGDVLLVVGRKRGAEEREPERALLEEGVSPLHALEDQVGPIEVEVGEVAEGGLGRRHRDHDQQNGRCDGGFASREFSVDAADCIHSFVPAASMTASSRLCGKTRPVRRSRT